MFRTFDEVYPFLSGVFFTIGFLYFFTSFYKGINKQSLVFSIIAISMGFFEGFNRLEFEDTPYVVALRIISIGYSMSIILLPMFIGLYGMLWKPFWVWFFSGLMVVATFIYQLGPETCCPPPWFYVGAPTFVGIFIYGIISAVALIKSKQIRKGGLFLFANTGSLIFILIFISNEFLGFSFGIGFPYILFLLESFMVFFVVTMSIDLMFDLLERSQIKIKLVTQIDRWNQTLEGVELIVVELDSEGIIQYINPFFTKLTGFNNSDILGANWFDQFLPKKDKSKLLEVQQKILKSEKSFYFQNPIVTKSGKQKMIYWSNVVLKDDDGKPISTLSIGTDVTDRERTLIEIEKLKVSLEEENIILKEEVLQKGNYDVSVESDVVNRAIQKVRQVSEFKELDRLKSQFFANISHEFRTPLTLILSPVRSMLKKNKDQKLKKGLSLVERNASKLLLMVNQLLDLSKLESGKMNIKIQPGDFTKSVNNTAASFDSLAKLKMITFKKVFQVDHLSIDFNEGHVEKIVNNILSNAFKFTEKNGKITLFIDLYDNKKEMIPTESLSQDQIKYVKIKVRDTGIGIDQSALPHIFDRFYQAESSSTTKFEGTGIGLALVKELVELYDGTIHIKSEVGWGTEVVIEFPLEKVYSIEKSKPSNDTIISIEPAEHLIENEDISENFDAEQDKNIVLVVEDNQDLREHMRSILYEKYNIIVAENGEEGLYKAIEKVPDLIVSDVMMPKMDGVELSNKLKQDSRTSHIPIILLTAKSSKEDKLAGLKSGVDEYLGKPFDADELKIRIENLIEIRRNLQQHFGNGEVAGKGLSREEEFYIKAKAAVEENLDNDQFSVEDLSGELNMSRVQFHRKIKALTNQSTTTFIRTLRLEKAKELLKSGDHNITEVAYMVGFSSQSYFTKSFQKHFGVPPSNISP